ADTDSRLNDSVAFNYGLGCGIDDRLIQGMSDGSNKFGGHAAGELRIGIESEDVANGTESGDIAHANGERSGIAANQAIQLEELSAFSLPSHPEALAVVVHAMAMEHEKGGLLRTILGV